MHSYFKSDSEEMIDSNHLLESVEDYDSNRVLPTLPSGDFSLLNLPPSRLVLPLPVDELYPPLPPLVAPLPLPDLSPLPL